MTLPSNRDRPRVRDYLPATRAWPLPPLRQDGFELDEPTLWKYLNSDEGVSPGLLMNYFADVYYVPSVDERVFLALLPDALDMWGSCFLPEFDLEALNATGELHSAFHAKSDRLRAIMGHATESGVVQFMRDTISWFIEGDCSLEAPNLDWLPMWVGAACGLPALVGSVFDMLESEPSAPIQASYLAYLSRFASTPADNPLVLNSFEGPEPWHRNSFVARHLRWTSESVDVARDRLRASHVRAKLERLRTHCPSDSLVQLFVTDILSRVDILEARAAEALEKLETFEPSPYWSDAF